MNEWFEDNWWKLVAGITVGVLLAFLLPGIAKVEIPAAPTSVVIMEGQIISSHIYTQSGGFLSGSKIHDITTIGLQDGTLINHNFSCSYFTNGTSVSVQKTTVYSNRYGDFAPSFSPLGNVTQTTGTVTVTTMQETFQENLTSQYVATTLTFEYLSIITTYSLVDLPSGC